MPQHTLQECALQMIASASIKPTLGLPLVLSVRFYSSALPFQKGSSLGEVIPSEWKIPRHVINAQ